MNKYYVYIMSNHTNSTLYVGMTNDVERRVNEHRYKIQDGFAERYQMYKLLYVEETVSVEDAIRREKQIKRWSREKKERLIQTQNPEWKDMMRDR